MTVNLWIVHSVYCR